MQRKPIQIDVSQHIKYRQQKEADAYEQVLEGTLTSLSSYKRIDYRDSQGVDIQVKWGQVTSEASTPYVEIKQPHATMRFQKGQTTYAPYPTPQGVWQLEIVTEDIIIQDGRVELYYYINAQEHILADYHFRLLYS